jgi:para-nitrobenzyl esterase
VPRGAYDRELADIIGRYWVQFATTGDPNVEGLPAWPPYNRETDTHLELGDEVGARSGFRREACELFEAMLETRMRAKR